MVREWIHLLVYMELADQEEGDESPLTLDPTTDDTDTGDDRSNTLALSPIWWSLSLLYLGRLEVFGKSDSGVVIAIWMLLHLPYGSNRPEPMTFRFPDEIVPHGLNIRTYPLPQNIFEALEQRGPRTWLLDFDSLRYYLAMNHIPLHLGAILDTHGVVERSVGHRRVVIQDLQQRSIVAGISQAWQDYAQQHDIMIRVVWPQPAPLVPPQPVLTVIVQILDPFRHIAPNAVPVLLEQRTNAGWDDSPQVMTTRAAEYLLAQTNGHEVLRLLRMQNSCQPRGLRRCRIHWRGHYHPPDDALQPRAGDYIISLADSLDIHFRNSESYFHRARRFALDGQRIMSQVCNVRTIEIDVHAIGTRNFPLGARVLTITMDWLIRPRDIWSQAVALWADRDANENSKLYHVDQQPSLTQSNPQDVLHLLLVIAPVSDVVPVLFGLTLVSSVTEELVAFCPSLCETPTDEQSLLRHSTYHRLVRALSGTFAIYSGYNQIGHRGNVDIPPGTMLTVQVTHRSRHQILHLLLDRLDAADSSTDSEEMSETPDLQQLPNTTTSNEARASSNTRCASLPATFGAPTLGAIIALRRNMWLGFLYASLLFLHPCRQLPPPGNGAWTGEDLQDHDLPPILDTRTHADLDALEGFVIEDRYVLLYEIPQRPASIRFELPFTLNQAISHFDAWPSGVLLYDYTAIPDLHPVAESFIHSAVPFDPENVDTIDIFVDGSTSKDDDHDLIASYAFVATTTSNNINGCTYSLYGFAGGCVSLQQQDSAWMGATHVDSMEAERCAVISALQWILQADLAWDVPVTVHFDCTAAGFAASGDWHVRSDSLTANLARCYCQIVQELLKNRLTLVHVPGHANVPGNELADSIAKAVAKQQLPSTLNQLDHRSVVQLVQEHGSWAWMRFGILNGSIDLPHLDGDQVPLPTVLTPNHSFDDIDLAPFDVPCEEPSESRLFNVCTLNVRSLFDDPSSVGHHRKFTEKAQYLADQLHWYGYHIVGLQESCSRHQGVSSFGNYISGRSVDAMKKGSWDVSFGSLRLWGSTLSQRKLLFACTPIHDDYSSDYNIVDLTLV